MRCPSDGNAMIFKNSGGSIIKRLGRAIVGGTIGAIGGPPGMIAGAAIGVTRKGKRDSGYWECPQCGYFEYIKRKG